MGASAASAPPPVPTIRVPHRGILVGVLLGFAGGLAANLLGWEVAQGLGPVLQLVGELFVRALKMLVLPLVVAALVTGVARLDADRQLGRLFARALGYYLLSSLAAICVGLLLVQLLRPGAGLAFTATAVPEAQPLSLGAWLRQLIPANPVAALAEGRMLPTILFAVLLGVALAHLPGERRAPLVGWFEALHDAMLVLTGMVLWTAPVGVAALVAHAVWQSGPALLSSLGWYALTVALGLVVHALGTLMLVLRWLVGVSPSAYLRALMPALTTAFSTASSAATLPVTLRAVERRGGVPGRYAGFVLPLGATINMDGTALYEGVATLFIAQVYGVHLGLGAQATILVTALLVSIGAAGVPMAGLVMMSIILSAVGLPLEGMGLVLAVDRLLDMLRTTVNVWSDAVGAAVLARLDGHRIVPRLEEV